MAADTTKVEISNEMFRVAQRTAALDNVDVSTLLESLVRRHADYIEGLTQADRIMPAFSLDDYELQRDPGEADESYAARLGLFR